MDGDDDSGLNAGQDSHSHDDSDVDLERGSGMDGEGEGEGEEGDGEVEETRRAAASKVAENLATARSYIGRLWVLLNMSDIEFGAQSRGTLAGALGVSEGAFTREVFAKPAQDTPPVPRTRFYFSRQGGGGPLSAEPGVDL